MSDQAISLQVSCAHAGITARVDGTPYSPDVFDDLVNRCVNATLSLLRDDQDAPSEVAGSEHENFVAFMEAKLQDDD